MLVRDYPWRGVFDLIPIYGSNCFPVQAQDCTKHCRNIHTVGKAAGVWAVVCWLYGSKEMDTCLMCFMGYSNWENNGVVSLYDFPCGYKGVERHPSIVARTVTSKMKK